MRPMRRSLLQTYLEACLSWPMDGLIFLYQRTLDGLADRGGYEPRDYIVLEGTF
jgi:hypothetical protein